MSLPALAGFLLLICVACFAQPVAEAESRKLLAELLPQVDAELRIAALKRIDASGDQRFVAPLSDVLRFLQTRDEVLMTARTALKLAGVQLAPEDDLWETLIRWVGTHDDVPALPGYAAWKGELHAQIIDPRFREFLYEGAHAKARIEEVVWGGVPVDGIPALVNPKMLPAGKATYLRDIEPVFGVSINGDDRAYPLRILDWHEMANDVVGGVPVALAYCTLCGAGILFDARADGVTYEFGSSGFLMRSNKLMYDRATRTLWNQLTGEPIIGKLAAQPVRLKVLPVVVTSWSEWKKQHPDTKVLSLDTGHQRPYEVGATYGRYFAQPNTMFPVWRKSQQLPDKARVYAVQLDGQAKAYPLDELNRAGGVANDTLGGQSLVVIYRDAVGRVPLPEKLKLALADRSIKSANDLTLAAARRVLDKDPKLLASFTANVLLAMPTQDRLQLLSSRSTDERLGDKAAPGIFPPALRNEVAQRGLIGETRAYLRTDSRGTHQFNAAPADRQTVIDANGATWRMTEEALLGPAGERLPRLGGHLAYWFGWFSYFPKTEVFRAAATAR